MILDILEFLVWSVLYYKYSKNCKFIQFFGGNDYD